MTSSINFPCKSCGNNFNDNDQAIQCELWNYWIHINYNNLNYIAYKFLQNSSDPWYCILSCSQTFPFNFLKSNKIFSIYVSTFHNNNKSGKTNIEGSLLLKPSENLKLLGIRLKIMLLQKIILTLKMLFNLNIMILMNYKL